MEAHEKQPEENQGSAKDIKPFRTASIMVNRVCNLKCRHCDIPERYTSKGKMLLTDNWVEVIRKLDQMLDLELIAVSAREPLMPGATRKKTLKIVETAKRLGKIGGIVTNGTYLKNSLTEFSASGLVLDYLDVSLEGLREIDDDIRGNGHFEKVMAAINDERLMKVTKKFFISLTLNARNCSVNVMQSFIDWMLKTFDEPRLAVLVLYPNVNVPEDLWLTDEQFLRSLGVLLRSSDKFADIFIDAFPGSIPGLWEIVEKGYLPGRDELLRDKTGMLWGHVGENLYVRYENIRDLMRYQVRITPEGRMIMPRDLEKEDYGRHAMPAVLSNRLKSTLNQIFEEVDVFDKQIDPKCVEQRCFPTCRGDNFRCSFLRREQ
ncbi:MAG: radical SAM protein [Thermodesulfobacteriota bacterium]|nr:radical SAM protein [Thermodesulfobacteriota bacterium]